MAARIAATAVEEGEARLGGPLPGLPQSFDGSGGGYTMLGAMYGTNGFDGLGGIDSMMSTMYTTVDPQILAPSLTGDFGRAEPSPPGGEWGSGSTPSSASPEPTFSASAPVGNTFNQMHSPSSRSTQVAPTPTGRNGRRIGGTKRLSQDSARAAAMANAVPATMRKKEDAMNDAKLARPSVTALANSGRLGAGVAAPSGMPALVRMTPTVRLPFVRTVGLRIRPRGGGILRVILCVSDLSFAYTRKSSALTSVLSHY